MKRSRSLLPLPVLFVLALSFGFVRVAAQETPLTAGQTVEIRISGVPAEEIAEVNAPYQIGDSGNINLPHIKQVLAAGLKPSELARKIERSYMDAEVYSRPIVNVVASREDVQRRVTVGGKVRAPQAVGFLDGMTLYEAILACGGFNEFAKKEATLRRDGKNYEYNMKKIDKNPLLDPRLKPGDVVIVD